MQQFFTKYPNAFRLLLGSILIVLALVLTSIIPNPWPKAFPFVGVILLVVANGIMYHLDGQNLSFIGFSFRMRNLSFLLVGLALGVIAVLIGYYLKSFLTGDQIHFNQNLNGIALLKQLYWILPTAAVQELVCRSYLYTKLIPLTNLTVANIIMAIVFVSMHDVFNIGIFGALFYAISIIIGHFVFANALLKSGTLLFAIGIHWGSNVGNNTLFTDEELQTSIFYLSKMVQPEPAIFNPIGILLYILTLNIGFIILAVWLWKSKSNNPILDKAT